jgi:polysaccharide biosynthesis protein PelA
MSSKAAGRPASGCGDWGKPPTAGEAAPVGDRRPPQRGNFIRRDVLKACAILIASSLVWTANSAWGWATRKLATWHRLRWIVFYGQTADEEVLSGYDIVVLDPMFQGSVAKVAKRGARVCGYLSLGEVRTSDTFYDRIDPIALLEGNPAWPGTRRIDVRQRAWKDLVLESIIPFIVAKGFTGLMLDTLDTPPYLEQLDPVGKAGMGEAAVDLVQAIRKSYPKMLVILNRGYALLTSVIDSVDGVIAESLLTTQTNDEKGCCRWNEPSDVALQLSLLTPAVSRRIRMPILTLDYWDPEDVETVRKIYAHERQLGHHPYVATRSLDRIIPEPHP